MGTGDGGDHSMAQAQRLSTSSTSAESFPRGHEYTI